MKAETLVRVYTDSLVNKKNKYKKDSNKTY